MLKHWGRDKMDAVTEATFSYPCMVIVILVDISLKLVLRWNDLDSIGSDNGSAPNRRATSHYLNNCGLFYWCIYVSPDQDNLTLTLQWRHNERDGVSNHQPHDCLLNHLFRRRSKNTSKLRLTGLCEGNSPVTGEFPTQRASNAENVSISWRHHIFFSHHCPCRCPLITYLSAKSHVLYILPLIVVK